MLFRRAHIYFWIICVSCESCPKVLRTFDESKCVNKGNIRIIRVQERKLTRLDATMVEGMTNVMTIDLTNNEISDIDPEVFKVTGNVTKIDLTNNNLKTIDQSTFGELKKLRSLYLNNNSLETIHSSTFHGFPKVHIVEFKNNNIHEIADDAFLVNSTTYWLVFRNNHVKNMSFARNLFNLSKLDCTSNEIRTIDEDLFENVTKLEDFQCMNNKIEDVHFLKNLKKLVYLDLSNNLIRDISVTTFANLENLREIIMSNNKLESVRTGTFSELKKLEKLVLNGNNLVTIGEIFDNLPSLRTFDVINNQLQQLSSETIQNSINFTLYLDGNNWTCRFIRNIFNKSPNKLVYTPQNNVTNYKNIACMDTDFKNYKYGTNPTTDDTYNFTTTSMSQPQEIFPTYILPFLVTIAAVLGVFAISYFVVFCIKRIWASNNKYGPDIEMSTLREMSYNINDTTGYLEPRRIAHEESIYEEITSMDNVPFRNSLMHVPARENEYIHIK